MEEGGKPDKLQKLDCIDTMCDSQAFLAKILCLLMPEQSEFDNLTARQGLHEPTKQNFYLVCILIIIKGIRKGQNATLF